MKLQNILFPNTDYCASTEAYFRFQNKDKIEYVPGLNEIKCEKDAELHFDTYFNCFSLYKWRKYTKINNVYLKIYFSGKFSLILKNKQIIKNRVLMNKDTCTVIESEEKSEYIINFSNSYDESIIYFSLNALADDSVFYGGEYFTDINESDINKVKIAVDICTYKREVFIKKNISMINEKVINNPESELHEKLDVYIADNGKTLDVKSIENGHIRVFPNINAGGAGGFTRAMMEIIKDKEKNNYTHILMMDDDIIFSEETLLRTYNMLSLLKKEYSHAFIGAAMLNLDYRHIQSEAADFWFGLSHRPIKHNLKINDRNAVLKNEIEEKINHFGWWYCAMPIGVIRNDNLPLPIFIKRDDIEYGLRNGKTFITMNGLCVWHEPFNKKRTGFLEYYYWRNACIINSIHCLWYGKKHIKKQIRERIKYFALCLRYKDGELCIKGVEDFLKGIDWLKETSVTEIHSDVLNSTYKVLPSDDLFLKFSDYEATLRPLKRGKINNIIRKITFKGLLLPAKRNITISDVNPKTDYFFRAKKVLHYNESGKNGFVTKKSYKELIKLYTRYFKLKRLINKKYEIVKEEYKSRIGEITNIDFWEKYLEEKPLEKKKEKKIFNIAKNKAALMLLKFIPVYIFRGLQHILWWYPVKKNRVTFFNSNMRGCACNLKYIIEYLKKNHAGKFEFIWFSKFPYTCKEIENLGIKVIRYGSLDYFRYFFTARINITNDQHHYSLIKRKKSVYINAWHGGMNYKRIGIEALPYTRFVQIHYFILSNNKPDVFVSGSKFFTENTAKSFNFKPSVFIPCGLPRNDIFFGNNEEISLKIRKEYGISKNKKILLFAPTFRVREKAQVFDFDFDRIINALSKSFGGEWIVFYRSHYFQQASTKIANNNIYDVSKYVDAQELLSISDILISDYSSCMWDFTSTGRPVFVYATDIESYTQTDRDFAYPLEKWPYPIARNNDELEYNILNFDKDEYALKVKQHHEDAGMYDDGKASERMGELIYDICLKKYNVRKHGFKNINFKT